MKKIITSATEKARPQTGMTAGGLFHEILTEGGSLPAKILKEEFHLELAEIAQSWAEQNSQDPIPSSSTLPRS